jgi:two-component system, OmpR family, sensor kinase
VLARLRDGHQPLRLRRVDLADLMTEAIEPVRAQADAVGVELRLRADAVTVDVDADRVRRAVTNVVDNAIRHGAGPVMIRATAGDSSVDVHIRDSGPGFPAAILPTAFEPFTRGTSPGTSTGAGADDDSGTGLGLAIVKAIAEAHGGAVTAANDPAGGGHIRIALPRSDQDDQTAPLLDNEISSRRYDRREGARRCRDDRGRGPAESR